MLYSIYEIIWIFIVYSFFGWCLEVVNATIRTGKFVNRGFLNGPYCPIYGFGTVIILEALNPYKSNLFLVFVGSILLTTVLEFITGYILERVFDQKWWDYSRDHFNLKGYVCLENSVIWGIASIFVIFILHPIINSFITWLPKNIGTILLIVVLEIMIIDFAITLVSLLKIKKRLNVLVETGEKIRILSDAIGKNISGKTLSGLKKRKKYEIELRELKKNYQELLEEKVFIQKRIVKAFPSLNSLWAKRLKGLVKNKK